MITIFVVIGDIVIKCISGVCGVVSTNNLQVSLMLGTVELFLEIVGMLRIYKSKDK